MTVCRLKTTWATWWPVVAPAVLLVIGFATSFGQDDLLDLPVTPPNRSPEFQPIPVASRAPVSGLSSKDPTEKDPRDEPPPVFYGEEIDVENGSIVFVLDRSGSMSEFLRPYPTGLGADGSVVPLTPDPQPPTRMEAAQQELERCIASLAPNLRFNVYAFDCATQRFSPDLQPSEPGVKVAAISWVNALYAGGATGTGPAMVLALRGHPECTSYVLLTDGEPNCGLESYIHRRMINEANAQGAAISVFGIAAEGGHRRFCQNVAADSGGSYYDVN